jgi:hypothetical protein
MEIEIIVDRNGNATMEVSGVVGPACEQVTEAVKAALDGAGWDEDNKDEYYEVAVETGVQV